MLIIHTIGNFFTCFLTPFFITHVSQDRITVRLGSWFDPLKDVEGELSGLVSNPPYIPSEDIDGLQAEVSRHEPRLALDGGANGMNDLIHLCNGAVSMLKPGGFFAFEVSIFILLDSVKII